MAENIHITMPTALADMFLTLIDDFQKRLDNAGCNEFCVQDTEENRQTVALAEAEYFGTKTKPTVYQGEIITTDAAVLAAAIKRFRSE